MVAMLFPSGGGGGGSGPTPGTSKNYVVADDVAAGALSGLRSGDTVRVNASLHRDVFDPARIYSPAERMAFAGIVYDCATATVAGESPQTAPAKWAAVAPQPLAEVRWWQVVSSGTYLTATRIELETLEARQDTTDVSEVASEADRLALPDRYSPFRVVRQTVPGETWMQVANPSSAPANWVKISNLTTSSVTTGGIQVTSGGALIITNTAGA